MPAQSDSPSFTVDADPRGVAVCGDIDETNAGDLQAAIEGQIGVHRDGVEVDLAGVTFFGSAAIRALVDSHRRATGSGSAVHVVNPSPIVVRMLTVAGLLDFLTRGNVESGGPEPT